MNSEPTEVETFAGKPMGWVRCRCGKERQVLGQFEIMMAPLQVCSSCEADYSRLMNRCPEVICEGDRMSSCERSWAHPGRCVSFDES